MWAVLWPLGNHWPGVTAVHIVCPHGQARASGGCPVVISQWPPRTQTGLRQLSTEFLKTGKPVFGFMVSNSGSKGSYFLITVDHSSFSTSIKVKKSGSRVIHKWRKRRVANRDCLQILFEMRQHSFLTLLPDCNYLDN